MARNLLVAKEIFRQKCKISLIKRIQSSYNSTVTDYYRQMESKLHSMKLTGDYNYKQITKIYGGFDFDYKYYKRNSKKIYNYKYHKSVDNFKLILFTDPLKPGPPKISIQIIPPDGISAREQKSFLSKMNDSFPNLRLSRIEFAIDIYFTDRTGVESLFEVIKRNIYVPKQRSEPKIYPKSIIIGKMRNHTISIGKLKVYERGDDKNKINEGWNREDINRVRMEYTSPREELKKYDLNYLPDLLRSSKFLDINNNKWNFKNFNVIKSKKIPGELDHYPVDGSFQGEYIAAKEKVNNRSRYLTDAGGFRWFKDDLFDAMKHYDLKW